MNSVKIINPQQGIAFAVELFKPAIEGQPTFQQELELKAQVLSSTSLGKREVNKLWSDLALQISKSKEVSTVGKGEFVKALNTNFYISQTNELFIATKNDNGETKFKIIANGIIRIETVERVEDALKTEMFMLGHVQVHDRRYPFRMEVGDYSANHSFGEKLTEATDTKFKFYEGELSSLRLFSKAASTPINQVISRNFGWDSDKYFTPSIIISRDQIAQNVEKAIVMPSNSVARFLDFKYEPDPIKYKTILKNFFENFLLLQDPSVTYFVLAHVFLSLVHSRFRDLPRPVLWISGLTGDGKSFIVIMAQNIQGDFPETSEKSRKISWTSSPKYISEQGVYFKDALFLVDDYKRSNISATDSKQIGQMIANISDGTGRGTLTSSRESNEQAVIRGLLIVTAEDIPPLDAAGFARTTLIQFPKKNRNIVAGRKLRTMRKDLSKIPPQFIRWFLNQDLEQYDRFFEDLRDQLHQVILGSQNDLRIATMAAQSGLGFNLLSQFLVEEEIWSSEEAETRSIEFKRILEKHVVNMSTISTEEQGSNLFLRVLSSLITAGEVKIHGLKVDIPNDISDGDHGALNQYIGRYVGFIKDGPQHLNTIYIDPEVAFNSVDRFLRASGSEVGFTKNTIGKQLLSDGHFSRRPSKDTNTMKQRWMKSEIYVWPLNPKSLGLTLPESHLTKKSGALSLPKPPVENGLI